MLLFQKSYDIVAVPYDASSHKVTLENTRLFKEVFVQKPFRLALTRCLGARERTPQKSALPSAYSTPSSPYVLSPSQWSLSLPEYHRRRFQKPLGGLVKAKTCHFASSSYDGPPEIWSFTGMATTTSIISLLFHDWKCPIACLYYLVVVSNLRV